MIETGHGVVGTREQAFTTILPADHRGYDVAKLAALANEMKGVPDTVKDGPDPEENLWVPAGYTYFGQFIDHDLTFDSTSSLDPADMGAPGSGSRIPTNLRTPRFDLDCVYGDGPDAQPFMYDAAGEKLLLGLAAKPGSTDASFELPRSSEGRAIIGDKRNDENSIVCQIQLGFIRFHNAVVEALRNQQAKWTDKSSLFNSARNEVRWTYQRLILEDFLPRIIRAHVLADLHGATKGERASRYALYTEDLRTNLPREFVGAAYRFGHSGVRTGYRLNGSPDQGTRLSIFPASDDLVPAPDSLLGFDPLPANHVIDDWARFFPDHGPSPVVAEDRSKAAGDTIDTAVRLQFAYKIDTTIVDPLGVLPPSVAGQGATSEAMSAIDPLKLPDPSKRPSLALLNLLRANAYRIHGGQAYARLLQAKLPQAPGPLLAKYLVIRTPALDESGRVRDGVFRFVAFDDSFKADTPLWLYVLAEAQASVVDALAGSPDTDGTFKDDLMLTGEAALTQLGWVGGRIVGEVMYGLIDSDPDSIANKAPVGWKPMIDDGGPLLLKRLLTFAPA